MTRALPRPLSHPDDAAARRDTADVPADDRSPELAGLPDVDAHVDVVAHVSGGLDGALRVAMMLRGRRYRVRDLVVDVRGSAVVSEVRATLALTSADTDLLLERLRRMPVVVGADRA